MMQPIWRTIQIQPLSSLENMEEKELSVDTHSICATHCDSHQFLSLAIAKVEIMLNEMSKGLSKLDQLSTLATRLEVITSSLGEEVSKLRGDNKNIGVELTRLQEEVKGIRNTLRTSTTSHRYKEMKWIAIIGSITTVIFGIFSLPFIQRWIEK